jgi:hypothetical protein
VAVQTFEAVLGSDDEKSLFIEVPQEVVAALGPKKRPPVRVTINGFPYRSTISVYGGRSYLPVRKEIREGARVQKGDTVTVILELDDAPRVVDVPGDMASALGGDAEASAAFDRLPYTHRKEYVEWIDGAKREETRQRRIAQALERLRTGSQSL